MIETMGLHFSKEGFNQRQSKVCQTLKSSGLDSILLFRQESMYYLTGYDTSGYTMFQVMYLGVDGKTGITMSLGETYIVTDDEYELVNHAPDGLVVN